MLGEHRPQERGRLSFSLGALLFFAWFHSLGHLLGRDLAEKPFFHLLANPAITLGPGNKDVAAPRKSVELSAFDPSAN